MTNDRKRSAWIRLFIVMFLLGVLATYVVYERPLAADVYPAESLTVGDSTRTFRLVVPHMLPEKCPVVFAFHGVGDSPEGMAAYTRLD